MTYVTPSTDFQRSEGRVQTPHSICGDRQSRMNTQPPAAVRRLISELGLRYRPNNRDDLQAHAARLALLADDCADIPPKYLERAIQSWVVKSPYLPKACDLIEAAKSFLPQPVNPANEIDRRRSMLIEMNLKLAQTRSDCVWDVDGAGQFYLRDL